MKTTSQLLSLLFLLCLVACEKDNETDPLRQEKVLRRKEVRNPEYLISHDSLEYKEGKLSRIVQVESPGTEKTFMYDGNKVQVFWVSNGALGDEPTQELEFDAEQRLKKVHLKGTGAWEYRYEHSARKPSSCSGTFNASFTFDEAGNLIHHEYPTPWGRYKHVYEYDDKVNPEAGLSFFEFDYLHFSENNLTNYKFYRDGVLEQEVDFAYEYDEEGYPVKMVSGRETSLYYYSYIDGIE